MKHYSILRMFLFIIIFSILSVGCSTQDEVEAVQVTENLIVKFDGLKCEYSGPEDILEGEITMVIDNLSESPATLDLAKLDDDKTWQDMLDYIGEPGSYKQRPNWITKETRRLVISDPSAVIFTPGPGSYVIVVYQTTPTALATFPCSPIEVH